MLLQALCHFLAIGEFKLVTIRKRPIIHRAAWLQLKMSSQPAVIQPSKQAGRFGCECGRHDDICVMATFVHEYVTAIYSVHWSKTKTLETTFSSHNVGCPLWKRPLPFEIEVTNSSLDKRWFLGPLDQFIFLFFHSSCFYFQSSPPFAALFRHLYNISISFYNIEDSYCFASSICQDLLWCLWWFTI